MMNLQACRIAGPIALAAPSIAEAQSLSSRLSRLEYTTVYGAAGDVFTSSGLESNTDLVLSGSPSLSFADIRSGFVLGIQTDRGRRRSAW